MTISTAGMIEAIREAAIKTETLEEHDVLNSIRAAMLRSGNSPVIPDGYAPLYWLVDGDANFYTISDQQGWIARIQMNGSITTQQQETWLSRRFVEGVRFCDASGSSLSQSEGGEA
ncbi:hypothetical protein PCO87_13975 [Pectobacteriaceae bacterium C52]|nr:hypothetical protein PCO87_13975 [Pectobacteriaceae bacterium C52]